MLETLRQATQACLEMRCAGLVTGPIHKGIINQSGIPFTGHTEFLAEISAVSKVVMMLIADQLRVALATTHLPLQEVPAAITQDHLKRRLKFYMMI